MSAQRETGPVKWFDKAKGFGFITRNTPSGSEDVFVHYNAIRGEGFRLLYEGQMVEYALQKGPKGLQAEDVTIIDEMTTHPTDTITEKSIEESTNNTVTDTAVLEEAPA